MIRILSVLTVLFAISFTASAQQSGSSSSSNVLKYYEEQIGSLVSQMKLIQDDNSKLAAAIIDMQKKIQSLSQSNQALAQEISTIKRQMTADAETRSAQLGKLEKLTREAIATPPPAPVAQPSGPAVDCVEYVVQAGATLSAIAKAYNVSVEDIRKTNKLSNDNLRVGQKLLIPATGKQP